MDGLDVQYLIEQVSGVEFEYYHVCKTQLWLFSHNLIKSDDDENVKVGRILHEERYKREKKDRSLFRSRFDVIKFKDKYVVYERKKEKLLKAHEYQLLYYLFQLHLITNSEVEGVLIAPGTRKILKLTDEIKKKIINDLTEIIKIKKLPDPPPPKKIKRCAKCAYRTFCFGDEYE